MAAYGSGEMMWGLLKKIDHYWLDDQGGYENIHRTILARLVQLYLISPKEKVVEVSCGSGLIYGKLVPDVVASFSYSGVDNSLIMRVIVSKRFPVGSLFLEMHIICLSQPYHLMYNYGLKS